MKKTGVSVSLPLFLDQSNLIPAFIINAKGRVLVANNLSKVLYSIHDTEKLFLNSIFTDNSFAPFFATVPSLTLSSHAISINSFNGGHEVNWEVSPFRKNLFICTGKIIAEHDKGVPVNESHLSAFFDNGAALMWATDSEGRIQMMNKRYKQLTGFTDTDRGKTIWEVYPKQMADQFKKNDDFVLKHNKLLKIEEVAVDKSGVKRNYLVYKFPLHTTDKGVMVAGCSIDITDIIEKNRQLTFQLHLLDSIEQAVYVLDANRKVVYWNSHAEKMYGWNKNEILHKDISVLASGHSLNEDMRLIIERGKSWDGEIELKRKDGVIIPVFITKSPVFDDENKITGFIGVSKDISEHKTVHKKLVKQNNQFRQIARLQSHAVRRPLANILGLIDLIQYYGDKGDYTELLYMINLLKESSEDLDDIIKKIVLKAGVYFDPALRIA